MGVVDSNLKIISLYIYLYVKLFTIDQRYIFCNHLIKLSNFEFSGLESPETLYEYEIDQFASIILILDHKFIYKVCSARQYLQNELSNEYVEQS